MSTNADHQKIALAKFQQEWQELWAPDEDDEGQDQASEGRSQSLPPPEQPAQGQRQGPGKILNS